ncbi:MAG: hypothetical protein H7836_11255 [Magnetococcus sp. YQC-3]
MAIQIPEQTLEDVIGELQAGVLQEQLLAAIKKIASNTINCDESKIDKKNAGEITLNIKINKHKHHQLEFTHTLTTKIPSVTGRGHSINKQDPEQTHFYAHGSGFISVNTINQDDWIIDENPKIRQLNQR